MFLADAVQDETVHPTIGNGFLAIDVDTVRNTIILSLIILGLALLLRRQIRPGRPGFIQNLLEAMIEFINGLIKDTLGTRPVNIAPVAITLFFWLLLANWMGLIPGLKSPTNDINTTLGLAILAIVLLHAYSIRFRGVRGYFRHYFSVVTPRWLGPWGWTRVFFAFLEFIQEVSRPITLSFRLYFNIFVGELMLLLIIQLLSVFSVVLGPVWVIFSIFIGAIQAFIFTVLMMAYIAMGTETEHEQEGQQGEAAPAASTSTQSGSRRAA